MLRWMKVRKDRDNIMEILSAMNEDWLLDGSLPHIILEKTSALPEYKAEYEQMSLFSMENSL